MTASAEAHRALDAEPRVDRPGYLVVRTDADGTYLGALMVTDHTGLPVDFRYTDPITPSRLQRTLYGGVLDRHLRGEVVARSLVGAVSHAPTVLFVDDRGFVDEPPLACPVVARGSSAAGPIGPPGAVRAQGGGSLLLQAAEGASPVRVGVAEGDEAAGGEQVVAPLVRLGATMDLLEPLERVRDALDLIAAGEIDAEGA